jgi:hypothetical protein
MRNRGSERKRLAENARRLKEELARVAAKKRKKETQR